MSLLGPHYSRNKRSWFRKLDVRSFRGLNGLRPDSDNNEIRAVGLSVQLQYVCMCRRHVRTSQYCTPVRLSKYSDDHIS